jgi:tetratricopeptide (TPR) repeat protein
MTRWAWLNAPFWQGLRWGVRLVLLGVCLAGLPHPRDERWSTHLNAADAAQADGRFAEAIMGYQSALALRPDDAAVLDKLVIASRSAQRLDAALSYLVRVAHVRGWTPALHRQAAALYTQQQHSTLALAHWQASLEDTPADRPALRVLIETSLARREWQATRAYLERWLVFDPRDEWANYHMGLLLAPRAFAATQAHLTLAANDPQYRRNAEAILQVYAQFPSDDPALLALRVGLVMLDAGAWSAAEHAFTAAIETNPTYAVALAFLGLARDQQGHDGSPQVERALALAPDEPQVRYVAAVHSRIKGDTAQALALLNELGTQNPRNAAVAVEIGTLYRVLGDQIKALEWYKVAVGLAPENEQFATVLATFYVDEEIRLQEEALLVIGNMAGRFTDNADILTCYGWALYRAGKLAEARIALERALSLNSTNSRTRYLYALFIEASGDRQRALEALLYVVQNAPEPRFRDLAQRALIRIGYRPDLADFIGKTQ